MANLEKFKINQLKNYLFTQVFLRNHTLFYLQPVSFLKLTQVLKSDHNFSLEQAKNACHKWLGKQAKNVENLPLDENIMQTILLELGYDFKKMSFNHFYEELQFFGFIHQEPHLFKRSIVVTVMGHVDHGKTTLLDVLRSSTLIKKEYGEITQKIGGYQVVFEKQSITFIDTPGHKLFSNMRLQGTSITDLVILVVAANEGVKEQTVEAIKHAQNAKVPIIVFLNKIDLPNSNAKNVMHQLDNYDLTLASGDGKIPYVQGSCLKKIGIKELLSKIIRQGENLNLKEDLNLLPKAIVIDSYLDKQGIKTVVIVKKGVFKIKDPLIVDGATGKLKAIFDDQKTNLTQATPGRCVVFLGLNKLVPVGSLLFSFPNEKLIQNLVKNFIKEKEHQAPKMNLENKFVDLESFWSQNEKQNKKINLIVKVDSKSVEQVVKKEVKSFQDQERTNNDQENLQLNFVSIGLSEVNLNDLNLATTTKSIIVTFNLELSNLITKEIKVRKIKHHNFYLLYEFFEFLEKLRLGKSSTKMFDKVVGKAKVLRVFSHSKFGTIAGCVVQKGTFKLSNDRVKILRDEKQVATNLKIKSLKHERETIKAAMTNQEFGIILFNFTDFKVGDEILQFQLVSENER